MDHNIGTRSAQPPPSNPLRVLATVLLLGVASAVWGASGTQFVFVGDASNANDAIGYGAVDHAYWLGAYEVTRAEYADFLNAVAATDTHALYNSNMGVTRSGVAGAYTYVAVDGLKPIAYVSWYDALRFANWLHNGQPVGPQTAATTEDGAYTFNGDTTVGPRNPGALFFLPTENEWYKAAYYQGGSSGSYWKYPTRSNTLPLAEPPPGGTNSANFDHAVGAVAETGSYGATVSSYGTFDQAGNVWEWTESLVNGRRGLRGGCFDDYDLLLQAAYRDAQDPAFESAVIGFRIAAAGTNVPIPTFTLTVQNGNGDGRYTPGTVVPIAADAAPAGMLFDRWTGNTSALADPLAASTTVTMPAAAVAVTATYKVDPNATFRLTVGNGSGSGLYTVGTVVAITANAAPAGKVFDRWTGDTGAVADPLAGSTTVTMPAAAVTVTATYKVPGTPTTLVITTAQWRVRSHILRVKGRGAGARLTVTLTDADTGTMIGTSRASGRGRWNLRKRGLTSMPARVRAACNGSVAEAAVTAIGAARDN